MEEKYLTAIQKEIELQKFFLTNQKISTIYFGGGTPSFVQVSTIEKILESIDATFAITDNREVTIEINPDDFTIEKAYLYKTLGFNRLSIGVQSFHDNELQFLGRRHNALQGIKSIEYAHSAGFDNISIDLIYGIPDSTLESHKRNIENCIKVNVEHISAYHLTIEKNTPLYIGLHKKQFSEIDEELSFEQYKMLIQKFADSGYMQYEISNFAKPGYNSKHNSHYWQDVKYIGFGPSANSYSKRQRHWNIADLEKYCRTLDEGKIPSNFEILDINDRYNDYVMTALRTNKGIDLQYFISVFNEKYFRWLECNIDKFIESGHVKLQNEHYSLTNRGKFISDTIISELFYTN